MCQGDEFSLLTIKQKYKLRSYHRSRLCTLLTVGDKNHTAFRVSKKPKSEPTSEAEFARRRNYTVLRLTNTKKSKLNDKFELQFSSNVSK